MAMAVEMAKIFCDRNYELRRTVLVVCPINSEGLRDPGQLPRSRGSDHHHLSKLMRQATTSPPH
jgi:hypothetical protein